MELLYENLGFISILVFIAFFAKLWKIDLNWLKTFSWGHLVFIYIVVNLAKILVKALMLLE